MAISNFTGQNIQDTYQKVVQTDGTSLADGTGSLLPISFDGNNVTISGSLTANEYIVSSSVTNITVATLSGSTEFGNTTDDTHTFIGNITASGGISSSGQINADKIRAGGYAGSSVFDIAAGSGGIDTDGTISSTGISNSSTYTGGGRVILSGASSYIETPSYVSASNIITTNITASGNISASGAIHTDLIFGNGTLNINPNRNGPVFLGNTHTLQVYGGIKAGTSTGTSHFFDGNITASSNISASGNIFGNTGQFNQILIDGESALNTTDSATTGQVFADSQITKLQIGKVGAVTSTVIEGNITASGNISSSGTIIATDGFGTINGGTF